MAAVIVLAGLLSADFIAVMLDGESRSKEQLIAALGSGDLEIWSIRIVELSSADPIEVRVDDNVTTVRYESDLEIGSHPIRYRHDSSGADYHHRLRTADSDTWVRSGDTWRELRAQSTAVDISPAGEGPILLGRHARRRGARVATWVAT